MQKTDQPGANGGILAYIRESKMEDSGNRGWSIYTNIPGGSLRFNRICASVFAPRRSERFSAGNFRLRCFFILAAICLLAPQLAHSQETESPVTAKSQGKRPVESELIVEGLASYGHYKIFASGSDCKLYTGGVEYDRHSWGRFLGARVDYVAEFLPLVLLDAPLTQDIWGTPTSPDRHIVPGLGFSPIGFRMLWRSHKAIKPYLTAKGGMLAFPQKVLSQKATYVDFSLQDSMGVQTRLTDRLDLRLGLLGDFHFSNDFMVPVNPGLDVMNATLGLSYHFRQ
jgi:hypothetical protein